MGSVGETHDSLLKRGVDERMEWMVKNERKSRRPTVSSGSKWTEFYENV